MDTDELRERKRRDAINQKHREYYRKYRDAINARRRWRYANDPEYRDRVLSAQHERNHDPEYKKRKNARLRERYATDEAYRAKRKAEAREYHRAHPSSGRGKLSQPEAF